MSSPINYNERPPIIGVVSFVDTLAITTQRIGTKAESQRVRRPNGGRGVRIRKHRAGWKRWNVEQPTRAAIVELQALFGADELAACFTVDVATDFLVRDEADADRLRVWFIHRLLWPRGRGHLRQEKSTVSFARGKHRARGLAVYSDRPSKVAKRPCMHV